VQQSRHAAVILSGQEGAPEATRNREIGNVKPVDAQRVAYRITLDHDP
jgi:hypothetical protein